MEFLLFHVLSIESEATQAQIFICSLFWLIVIKNDFRRRPTDLMPILASSGAEKTR